MSGFAPVVVALSAVLAQGQESSQSNEHLQSLRWLIGRWESVPNDAPGPPFVVPDLTCKWILNNQFIVMTMDIASPDAVSALLRAGDPPVVTRIEDGLLVLDPRTVLPEQEGALLRLVAEAVS